jgi:Uma2 family endonuclease
MAITPLHPATEPVPSPDAYPYGWRYVPFRGADGRLDYHQIPLTLEDVLHPQEDDQVTESVPHERRRRYLADVLTARLAHDPSAAVLSDVLLVWGAAMRSHSPDIAVVLGVQARQEWSTFDVTAEGVRPALIIELTSPGTAVLDRRRKVRHYRRVGVPQYVIVDAVRGSRLVTPRLIDYRLAESGYRQQPPDSRGRVWLEAVRLWLGVVEGEIVCFDEADQPLGDYPTQARALEAAEQARVAAEQARAQAEREALAERAARAELEQRLRTLEEELRQRG